MDRENRAQYEMERDQELRHKVDCGGHVHPNFCRGEFLRLMQIC